MLEFYKTFEDGTRKIAEPEPGCWINAVAPTEEERNYLIEQIGVLPEFVKSSLDEEESSHMDYDDDFRQLLIIFELVFLLYHLLCVLSFRLYLGFLIFFHKRELQ